jgi:copper(I)-binding protein
MNSTNALHAAKSTLMTALVLAIGSPAFGEVVASEAWTRATAPNAAGVGYLVLTNKGSEDAKLLKIVSPVSDKVTIHRSSIDNTGVSRMWAVARLQLAPGETVRFEPNGLHIMFSNLKAPFAVGQKIPLQLTFEGEPEFTVMLEVQPLVPAAGSAAAHR